MAASLVGYFSTAQEVNVLHKSVFLAALLTSFASVASAGKVTTVLCKIDPKIERGSHCVNAPEIDPASALAGLTLLVGGLAVFRGRRSKS